ncbi:MAG: tellurite resistance TerB family protein [Rhizobiaceae bacterium]|nr:tellurite resistance TerB family protein [Rhizobiaceae bacterium]
MSLLGTLAKVAVGIAVAKGVGGMMKKSAGTTAPSGGGLLGDLLSGGSAQNTRQAPQGGGLGDLLGSVLGGQGGGGMSGGLGGLLEQLGGGMSSGGQQGKGGLGDLLGNLTSGAGGSGGLGGMLGGLLGGVANSRTGQADGNTGSFGEMLNDSFQRGGEPKVQPSQEQEAMAALMLRAMIQATKADGELDEKEREKLLSNLGEVSKEEMAFVRYEMKQPVDVEGLAAQVPKGLEQQVYTMSVMAIDLDSQAEAQYLHKFRTALNMDQRQVNMIHDQLGVQKLYS